VALQGEKRGYWRKLGGRLRDEAECCAKLGGRLRDGIRKVDKKI